MMLTIALFTIVGGFLGERRRSVMSASEPPPRTSAILVLFSVAMVASMIGEGTGRSASTPVASPPGPTPFSSESALGAAPVYPGPSNGAPLPRLNLPITYYYGPGPRHPVPPPSPAPPPAVGAAPAPVQPSPTPSATGLPVPPPPLPACASGVSAPSTSAGPIVIGPCTAPSIAPRQ